MSGYLLRISPLPACADLISSPPATFILPRPPMRPLKNLLTLLRELWAFAREHKAWWILPVVALLLLAGVLIVGVSSISPFIYSLF